MKEEFINEDNNKRKMSKKLRKISFYFDRVVKTRYYQDWRWKIHQFDNTLLSFR